MKEYISYCGLNCETCNARLATIFNDDALREAVAALWSKLNDAEITPDMINCTGCRIPGAKTPYCDSICPIRQCAVKKRDGNLRQLPGNEFLSESRGYSYQQS